MGLLQQNGVNINAVDRIEISIERPEVVGYRIRIEGVSIEGNNISSNAENNIHNSLVDNEEFDTEEEVINKVANRLGISTDYIEII